MLKLSKRVLISIFTAGLLLALFSQCAVLSAYFSADVPNSNMPDSIKKCIKNIYSEPTNSQYHLDLALAYAAQKKDSDASKQFLDALKLDPTNPHVYLKLAGYHISQPSISRLREAYDEYKKAIFYSEYKDRSKVLEEMYEKYKQNYLALSCAMPMTAESRFMLAGFLRGNKRFKESARELRKAIILADKNYNQDIKADSLNWIAVMYMWDSKYDTAANYFKAAVKINNKNSWFFYNMGVTYLQINRLDEAKRAFEESIRIDRTKSEYYLGLGSVYEKMGSSNSARKYYLKALAFKPDGQTKAEINGRLKQLGY